jgi:myb proto-oncogene protein
VDGVTTDLPDDTTTFPVTPVVPLPSAAAPHAPCQRRWKEEEDTKLTEAVKKHGKDWVAVAALVPGRSNIRCRERWINVVDPVNGNKGKPRRNWKPEEDAKLTKAVKKHGTKDWVAVAALVSGRSNIQCHQRWINSLDPANGKKGKWTPAEATTLTEAVKKHGKKWVAVAAMVPGRTYLQCRQRWFKN